MKLVKTVFDNNVKYNVALEMKRVAVAKYIEMIMKEKCPDVPYNVTKYIGQIDAYDEEYVVGVRPQDLPKTMNMFGVDCIETHPVLSKYSKYKYNEDICIDFNKTDLKIIGVTGGIGAGKSFLMKQLDVEKYITIDLDSLAKVLIDNNKNIIKFLTSKIDGLYENGSYDKQKMKDWLFERSCNNKIFNRVLTREIYNYIIETFKEDTRPIIVEGATIFESLFCRYTDAIINVNSYGNDVNIIYDRVAKRSNLSSLEVDKFRENQITENARQSLSDITVTNFEEFNVAIKSFI